MTTSPPGRLVALVRRLVVALVAVAMLLGLGLTLAGERIYPWLLEFVARTGADLQVTSRGRVTVEYGPGLRITASALDVAPLGGGDWQAEIGEIRVDVGAAELLRGRLRLDGLMLANSRLRIQRSRQGASGIPFALLAGAHTRIENLDITVEGGTPADRHVISLQDAEIQPARGGHPQAIARGSIDGHALSVDARLATSAEALDGGMSYPLQGSLEVAGWNLKATLHGHVAQPAEGKGLALQADVEISDIAPLATLLGTRWPTSGTLSLHASLAGDLPTPRLVTVTASLEDGHDVRAHIEGADIAPASREVGKLDLHFKGSLPAGLIDDNPALQLEADVSLAGRPGDYRVTVDSLQAVLANKARLTATGTLALHDAPVSLDAAEFEKLNVHFDGALPAGWLDNDPGLHVAASVSLAGKPGAYLLAVDSLRASLADGSHLTATGTLSLGNLQDWASARSQLHLEASVADLASLSGLTGYSLHAVELVAARADLTGTLGNAVLESLRAQTRKSGRNLVTIEGRLGPFRLAATDAVPKAGANTDLQLVLAPTDSRQLDELLGVELRPPGTWEGRWRVRLSGDEWHLGSVSVTAGREDATRIRISGEAHGRGALDAGMQRILTGKAGMHDSANLQVGVQTYSARATAGLLSFSLPELGAVKMQSRLLVSNGHYALRDIDLRSEGELGLTARGSVGALRTFDDVDLHVALAPASSELVGHILDLALPSTEPVGFELAVRREARQPTRITGNARVGSSQFEVDLTAEHTGSRPVVKGSIHSASVATLDFWQPEPAVAATPAPSRSVAPAGASTDSGPLGILGLLPGLGFVLQESAAPASGGEPKAKAAQQMPDTPTSDDTLPWHSLLGVDMDLAISVDEWRGRELVAGPLDVRLLHTGGRIEFGPLNLRFKGGSLELHGVVDANADPPTAHFNGRGVDIPIAELVVANDALASEIAGDLSFDYKLDSEGLSVAALRASMSGEIRVVLENAQLPLGDLRLASGQLWRWLLTWAEDRRRTPVPCAVAQFEINDGIATAKTLFLKSSAAAVYGAGTIDLRTDTIDLRATPKARGLAFGRPTTLHIRGPLSAPTVDTESSVSVLLQYGGSVAGSAIFPPSMLFTPVRDLLDGGDDTPCR